MLPKGFINFLQLKLIDSFKISKINVKFEHHFIVPFWKHLHKLSLCTLPLLILITYTDKHVGKTFCCKSLREICCHVIENVLKFYVNVTCTILKARDTSVIYE